MQPRRDALRRGAPLALAIFFAGAGAPRRAHAEAQLTTGLTTGVAVTDLRGAGGAGVTGHLGGRGELLFGRSSPRTMGVGPDVEALTVGFKTFEGGGGLAWMFPAWSTGFVLSGGAFARTSALGFEPGAAATLFWGSRSFNHHGLYALGVGLFAQGRYGLGDSKQADALFGVQLDLQYLALPFLWAAAALR